MYHLTPETLIRIEDAADPKRGFITKPWGEICTQLKPREFADMSLALTETFLEANGRAMWRCFVLIHPNAITEV